MNGDQPMAKTALELDPTSAKRGVEHRFDATFTAALAQREKQIQQSYRPIIGVHKWFARRPGTVFRNLLLAEFNGDEPIAESYWRAHEFQGVIADPFMGGGTPLYESNRLGFNVVGTDINPMAFWVVRQSLAPLDLAAFADTAEKVIADVEEEIGQLYRTRCDCGADVTVKYFIWVKTQACPECGVDNDLFPGYLLSENERHPKNVVACRNCGQLNEIEGEPHRADPATCTECGGDVFIKGTAAKNRTTCRSCATEFRYPPAKPVAPPVHRMWAIEYHCHACDRTHKGRFFKRPDVDDLARFERARSWFDAAAATLPIPNDEIPDGDETRRLHRWGYQRFREMFNERQLLGLGLLLRRIMAVETVETRHALLTVFSDFLRYQNMLARYDTYALKCQDIFSVHGFPVGLVQCENNLLGIPKVGSGAFRHFIEKYRRAKQYCEQPFETRVVGKKKEIVPIHGEHILADFVSAPEAFTGGRQACLRAATADAMTLAPNSLDGVFTDPPYYDNIQYAELMDFCYAWLRQALGTEFEAFRADTTRAHAELTGNDTMCRGIEHFTDGLSRVFQHYAAALKPGAPFVFTYHHNNPLAYLPLVVAILDAGLDCTATLPAPAEMSASLHIAGSSSSVLDSIFVCRRQLSDDHLGIRPRLERDAKALMAAGLSLSDGDLRCLLAGHVARVSINHLRSSWDPHMELAQRIQAAKKVLEEITHQAVTEGATDVRREYERNTEDACHVATI